MSRLKHILVILLFFLLFTNILIFAQTAEYEYTFTFSDQANNVQELILGKDPYGTDGIDTLFGEEFVPQVPPGEFGVRFQLAIDTSITIIKDIRFGCYQATGHEHLVDLNYDPGFPVISVDWEWDQQLDLGLMDVLFINPYNSQIIASFSWSADSSHFVIPQELDKIKIWTLYNGTISAEDYELYSPNGGEILEAGQIFEITWWNNQLGMYYNIEFSSDSGKNWSVVADSVSINQNSYQWIVPQLNSEYCLIRVGSYPCFYDQSDSFFTIVDPVSIDGIRNLSTTYSLSHNYPNPFNPYTKIKFNIPVVGDAKFASRTRVVLKVYDVLGNEIATLVDEEKPAGDYEVDFDGTGLTSGIYFYRFKGGTYIETKKMILLR